MTRARNSADLASQGNLFADISNDRIGIGSVVPTHKLHVAGTSKFDDDVKFEGTTAARNIIWDKSADRLNFSDIVKASFGAGGDLTIYHNGSNSYLDNGTGDLYLRPQSDIYWQNLTSGDVYLKGINNGAVEIYYDGNKKFETLNTGAKVTGNLEVTGVLTYDDVTSIDSVGIVTARAGVKVTGGNVELAQGTGTGYYQITQTNGNTVKFGIVSGSDIELSGSSNNSMYFKTNNTERLRIDSSGKIGISRTPTQHPLEIQHASEPTVSLWRGSTKGSALQAQSGGTYLYSYQNAPLIFSVNSANGFTERLRITSAGNLLVGKNSVYGSGKAQVHNTTQYCLDVATWAADATGPTVDFYKSRNATPGSNTIVQSGDVIGRLRFMGMDGSNARTAAQITIESDGTPGTNDMPGRIVFATTADGASSSTERLRIKSDGGLRLVKTGGNANFTISRNESVGTTNQAIGVIDFASNTGHTVQARVMGKTLGTSNVGGDLAFETRASGGSLDERLRITGSGQVNIGGNYTQTDRMLNVYGGRIRVEGITTNQNTAEFYGNTGSGQSYGLLVSSGTTNGDQNSQFRGAGGTNYMKIRGDGVILIGSSTVQQGSTSKLEVMGTLNNSYPGYSYPIMVSDDAAYDSSGGPGGGIGFSFKQNSGGAYAQAGGIRGIKENTTNANYASALTFYTRADQAGTAERLRITSDGRLFVNTTAVTNTDDALTIKRPAGSHSVTSLTVDATTATGSYANALIFTKAKDYYYNGIVFTSSDGHQGGIAGKMTTNGGTTPQIEFRIGGTSFNQSDTFAMFINADGDLLPGANGARDLGSSSYRWENLYTSDLDLSNESKGGNEVDGTWGAYTIQEGEDDLFLINNRNGKKYKFLLKEVD